MRKREKNTLELIIYDFYESEAYGGRSSEEELRLRYQVIRKQLIKHSNNANITLLDVGCGNGSLYRAIKDIIPTYIGIDISINAIRIAKRTSKEGEFIVASALLMPFRHESFKLILCSEVLEHIPRYKVAISEISRVLRENGELILTTPNHSNPYIFCTSFLAKLLKRSRTHQVYDRPIPYHLLISCIQNSNLNITYISSFYEYSPPPSLSLNDMLFQMLLKLLGILAKIATRPTGIYLIIVCRKCIKM